LIESIRKTLIEEEIEKIKKSTNKRFKFTREIKPKYAKINKSEEFTASVIYQFIIL
jgi:hypothetical protein